MNVVAFVVVVVFVVVAAADTSDSVVFVNDKSVTNESTITMMTDDCSEA